MKNADGIREPFSERLDAANGGNYTPGDYREEAKAFLKACMDEKTYNFIMSHGDGRNHPYVAAKIYLESGDWEKYIWIEHHGSLDGFPG